jgi:hypothetical protein
MATDMNTKTKLAENLARSNPKVDRDALSEAFEVIEQLKQAGITPQGYQLRNPYETRTIHSSNEDPWIE